MYCTQKVKDFVLTLFRSASNAASQTRSGLLHRGLGVHLRYAHQSGSIGRGITSIFSFVRSISLDVWNGKQLSLLEAGGNRKAGEWFRKYGIDKLDLAKKYSSPAAEFYRVKLKSIVEGKNFTDPDIAEFKQQTIGNCVQSTTSDFQRLEPTDHVEYISMKASRGVFEPRTHKYDSSAYQKTHYTRNGDEFGDQGEKGDIIDAIRDGWNTFSSGVKRLTLTTAETVSSGWGNRPANLKSWNSISSVFSHQKKNDNPRNFCSSDEYPMSRDDGDDMFTRHGSYYGMDDNQDAHYRRDRGKFLHQSTPTNSSQNSGTFARSSNTNDDLSSHKLIDEWASSHKDLRGTNSYGSDARGPVKEGDKKWSNWEEWRKY